MQEIFCITPSGPSGRQGRGQGTGEPIFTNCTDGFFGTLDYIFYTDDTLAPLSLLELPTEGECRSKYGGLPNTQCSSDHVSLMAEFQWGARQW